MFRTFSGKKERAEFVACGVALFLALVKGTAAFWTGTLALAASALDSLMDFFLSFVNLISIRIADRPADADHTYGHGKAEAIAGLLQSLLIFASAIYLLYSSIGRLLNPRPVVHLPGGITVMAIAIALGFWISRYLKKMAVATGSVVLKSDSVHYAMDLYTQGGILLAFFVIQKTGWTIADPLVTIPITFYVGFLAFSVGKEAVDELMDRETSPEVLETVRKVVSGHAPQAVGMHNFKSRRAGSKRFVQFHLEIKRDLSFLEVHELTERITGEIRRTLGDVQVIIHPDPEGVGLDQSDLM